MEYWAKQGIISKVVRNPNSTNKYGADYYRKVRGFLSDIIKRNDLEKDM